MKIARNMRPCKIIFWMTLLFSTQSWADEQAVMMENVPLVDAPHVETHGLTRATKTIVVHPASPTFRIRVAAPPGAGTQWFLGEYNPRMVKLLDQKYVTEKTTKSAAALGISVWDFQLQQTAFIAPQVTHIVLESRRLQEAKAVKRQTFTVVSSTER
jgi:predicted secreted protein